MIESDQDSIGRIDKTNPGRMNVPIELAGRVFDLCCPNGDDRAAIRQFGEGEITLARVSQGSRREAPPNGIACKAREGFQGERYADIP
jgi:hypothetical protein